MEHLVRSILEKKCYFVLLAVTHPPQNSYSFLQNAMGEG